MKIFKKLHKSIRQNNITQRRVECLYSQKKLYKKDIELIYRGLFISSTIAFENFIENLFVGLLCNRICVPGVIPKIKVFSRLDCLEILKGRSNYVDWLPYDNTKKVANKYFQNGHPFTKITNNQVSTLNLMCKIRNVIAHDSSFALESYMKDIKKLRSYTHRYENPITYLRDSFSSSPPQTNYEQLFTNVLLASLELTR